MSDLVREMETLPLGLDPYVAGHDELYITLDGSQFRWDSKMVIDALNEAGASNPDPDCFNAGCAECLDRMISDACLDDIGASAWVWECLEEARPELWGMYKNSIVRSAELIADHKNLTAMSKNIHWTIEPMIAEPEISLVEDARLELIESR